MAQADPSQSTDPSDEPALQSATPHGAAPVSAATPPAHPPKPPRPPGPFKAMLHALRSPDQKTRRVAVLFFVFCLGAVVSGVGMLKVLKGDSVAPVEEAPLEAGKDAGKHLGEFLAKENAAARLKSVLLNVGQFTITLKPSPDQPAVRGVMNLAEIDIFVECDTAKTCDYIEQKSAEARNQISDALFDLDRESLLSKDGKRRLKRQIMNRVNGWLPEGHKLENLYFSKLTIG